MIFSSSNLNILGTPPSLREWRPSVNTKYQEAYQNNHEEHLHSLMSVAEQRSQIYSTIIQWWYFNHDTRISHVHHQVLTSDSQWNLNAKYVEAYENKHRSTRFRYRKEEDGHNISSVASKSNSFLRPWWYFDAHTRTSQVDHQVFEE